MKIKISEAFALKNFCDKISDEPLPVQIAYKFAKLSINLTNEVVFYQKQYTKYLEEYALRNEDGFAFTKQGNIKIIPGKEEECKEKMEELDSMEIEIPDFSFYLGELKNIKISISDMKILTPFIKEPLRGE